MKVFNPSKITSKYRANFILSSYKKHLKKNSKILDLGCGTGVVSKYLNENLGVKITGCDIKNYLQHDMPFVKIKNNGNLPFKTNSFDVVMLNDVLHHVEKPEQINLIKEALRVGKKVLIFEVKPTISGKLFDIVLNKFHYGDLKAPLAFRNEKAWGKVFEDLNAKYKTQILPRPFFYPFSHIAFVVER